MAELKISGRMSVKRLKENFKNEFGGTLRVYDGREKADDNATLASIRRNNEAKGGEYSCQGNRTVGRFEREMREIFGIKVQVATPDDWTLVLDGITLAKLKHIPEKTSKADMESLVAYKRKNVAEAEVEQEEVDIVDEVTDEESNWCDECRDLTGEELAWLNGKSIAVGFDYEAFEDSDIEWEDLCLTDGLDYKFRNGEVFYGNGVQSDDLGDINFFEFSKDEELKDVFAKLYDDEARKVFNLVLNLINRQMDDFPDIAEAIVKSVPISSIIMYDEDDNPIVEACSINFNLDYFQSYI